MTLFRQDRGQLVHTCRGVTDYQALQPQLVASGFSFRTLIRKKPRAKNGEILGIDVILVGVTKDTVEV